MADNVKLAMEKIQEALDDYERSLGLLSTSNIDSAEINGYFTMTRDQINSLSPLDANEIAVRLIQYCIYIQKEHNKEQSRFNWSVAEITKYVSDKLDQISGYVKYENKVYLLAKQDEFLAKLTAIRDYAQVRLDRLTYLATSVRNLADCFINCSRTKLGMREK
jgi:hypothetical protein